MSPPVAYPVRASEAETADAVNLAAPADVTLVLDPPAPSAEPGTSGDTPEAEDPADGASAAESPSPADSDSPPVHVGSASQPCQVQSLPDVRRCRGAVTSAVHLQMSGPASTSCTPTASVPVALQSSTSHLSACSAIGRAPPSVAAAARAFASPLSSLGPFCRICHEGESREQLIAPCRCTGSVGLVHVSCIEKWLSAANKDSCEICMYRYVTERRPKPALEWLLNPSNPEDARNLIGDIICFFLLTALAVIAAYLCLMGASHYLSYKTQWEATGLVVLGLLISCIYFIWLGVTCRYHWRVWRDWRGTHQDVHLLEMKRRSHSTVELNNNGSVAAGICQVCQGGSYSCTRCCGCLHHAVQLGAESAGGADDVFGDETAAALHAK